MISNFIVILSLVFGLGYTFIWFLNRDLRAQIERPKHHFQNQVEQFDINLQNKKIENDRE